MKKTPAQIQWIKVLHTAKNALGLDDDNYRVILQSSAGVDSAAKITSWAQYESVLASFKVLGFTCKGSHGARVKKTESGKRSPHMISYRQEYYIRGLWSLASRAKDEASLRAMVQRVGGVDDISFLTKLKAADVITALRDICTKAGFNPDSKDGSCF